MKISSIKREINELLDGELTDEQVNLLENFINEARNDNTPTEEEI